MSADPLRILRPAARPPAAPRAPSALLALVALLASAAGCRTVPPAPLRSDAELSVHQAEGLELRTDLPQPEAEAWLARLLALRELSDQSFPPARSERPAVCVILSEPARFALYAQAQQVDPQAGAFATPAGELVYRYRAEEWQGDPGPPYPIEPRTRPLAAAFLRARLLSAYGPDLRATWVEEGLAARFAHLAAERLEGRPPGLATQARQTLIDAYLPLYLGGPPVLGELLAVRGRDAMRQRGSQALARAAVEFLAGQGAGATLLGQALADAAGREGAEEAFEAAREACASLERPFERYLQEQTLGALLETLRAAPTPVDRWESAAVLRLIANLDLDPDLPDELRARQVDAALPLLAQNPPAVRFLDRYAAELRELRERRSQLEAMRRLQQRVGREFDRRTQGYGHPAIEPARKGLGRALQRAYRDAGGP